MAEKRIQPKAAKIEPAKSATAAAGVQKKSLRRSTHKKSTRLMKRKMR